MKATHVERAGALGSGAVMLGSGLALLLASGLLFWFSMAHNKGPAFVAALAVGAAALLVLKGMVVIQPNEAANLQLFGGAYKGTVRQAGLGWVNPFVSVRRWSLRARTLQGPVLKVNDARGNPIEIAAVLVWRIVDAAKAAFDVEDVDAFVKQQLEAAVRHLAARYAYDRMEGDPEDAVTLLGSSDEIASSVSAELAERLAMAGVEVAEVRLTHLAYAPEIAGAMLRRQQAEAVLAARRTIVAGAVGMVGEALKALREQGVVDLDDERKASMVNNLMTVLCAEREAAPVVNTGTLYS